MVPTLLMIISQAIVSRIADLYAEEVRATPRRRERRRLRRAQQHTPDKQLEAALNLYLYKGKKHPCNNMILTIQAEIITRECPEAVELLRKAHEDYRQDKKNAECDRNCFEYPEITDTTILSSDELRKEMRMRNHAEADPGHMMHVEHLERQYGPANYFSNKTTYKNCTECRRPLKVWRNCGRCCEFYAEYEGEGIFIRCWECDNENHQRDLHEDRKCYLRIPGKLGLKCMNPTPSSMFFF